MRILPLVRRQPGEDEQRDRHAQIGRARADPHFDGKWRQEGEQVLFLLRRLLVQNADA